MKTLKKTTKTSIISFSLVMMLFGSANLSAQTEIQEKISVEAYQAETLFAFADFKSAEKSTQYIFHNPLKNEKFEKSFATSNELNIEITTYKLMEVMEVALEEDMMVQEWMMTNFSVSAQTIACQPISAEPVLEVEDWMVSDSAWTIE